MTTDELINSTNVLLIVLSNFWLPTLHEEEHLNVELLSSDDIQMISVPRWESKKNSDEG